MEDAHTVHLDLKGDKSSAYFAVFDGHGSSLFAEYCSNHLHERIAKCTDFGECNNVYIYICIIALLLLVYNIIGIIRQWERQGCGHVDIVVLCL